MREIKPSRGSLGGGLWEDSSELEGAAWSSCRAERTLSRAAQLLSAGNESLLQEERTFAFCIYTAL